MTNLMRSNIKIALKRQDMLLLNLFYLLGSISINPTTWIYLIIFVISIITNSLFVDNGFLLMSDRDEELRRFLLEYLDKIARSLP